MKKATLSLILSLFSVFLIAQQSYYNDVNLNLTGISLRDALANKIITTHTNNLQYSQIWDACQITDVNPQNASEVLLIYGWENGNDDNVTNDRERDINNNGGNVGQWNREHVYPNSLGTPDLDQGGTFGPPYADVHNLRPSDAQRNSSRGNKKFISGSGNSGAVGSGWYPGDEWRGDVARIMMYMYLRYGSRCLPTNVGFGNSSDTPDEMIDLFLQWNVDDPVSDFEETRNEYHGNTSNDFAQGNRNPFIDNPRLATRIWGGPEAEDIWGIYTNNDTEAPSIPMNLVASNITTSTIDLTWSASTDNVGVSSYEVYVNNSFEVEVSSTNYTISGLASDIEYNLSVLAKDVAENSSAQSIPLQVTTLADTEAPSVPTNIIVSNETNVSFKISWTASTDNTIVTGYNVYLDGTLNASPSINTFTPNGLTPSSTYAVTITALDAAGNESAQSIPVNATTTNGTGIANELFISEYVEGGSNNKAIEIANVTNNTIDLTLYNLRRQGNGQGEWSTRFGLTGNVAPGDVVVIVNGSADNSSGTSASAGQYLVEQADIIVPNNSTTNFGEPLNFNGNDPVGLFKDDLLIDIIGEFDGGSANFAKDVTLRRKTTVTEPNTTFDLVNEWDSFPKDTVDDIGQFSQTLTITDGTLEPVTIYPNPVHGDNVFLTTNQTASFKVYNFLGQLQLTGQTSNTIDISPLNTGVYMIQLEIEGQRLLKKLIIAD